MKSHTPGRKREIKTGRAIPDVQLTSPALCRLRRDMRAIVKVYVGPSTSSLLELSISSELSSELSSQHACTSPPPPSLSFGHSLHSTPSSLSSFLPLASLPASTASSPGLCVSVCSYSPPFLPSCSLSPLLSNSSSTSSPCNSYLSCSLHRPLISLSARPPFWNLLVSLEDLVLLDHLLHLLSSSSPSSPSSSSSSSSN